jgi:hypothetical protein
VSRSYVLVISVLLTIIALSYADASPSLVINVFRHGARGPTQKKVDKTWDPSLYGQLTPVGMRQQYLLGAALAKKYPNLFNKPFSNDRVYVRSSQSTRCVHSVISQLYGAFQGTGPGLNASYPSDRAVPPYDPEIVGDLLKELDNKQVFPGGFVPVVVNSVPVSDDDVLETPSSCPALYADAAKNVFELKFWNFWSKTLAPTKKSLEALGIKVKSITDFKDLIDTNYCNYYQNKELIGNITFDSELFRNMTLAATYVTYHVVYSSERQKALLSVPLFDEAFQFLDKKVKGSAIEVVLLSTHDTAVFTILTTLGIVNEDCLIANFEAQTKGGSLPFPNCIFPPFAANVIFEFYENSGSPYVVLKYNDQAIPLCNGKAECPYQDFKALVTKATKGYTAKDYHRICKNQELTDVFHWVKDFIRKDDY